MKKPLSRLLLCAFSLVASVAHAQTLGESLKGESKSEYDAGRSLLEINDSQGAFLKFKHSYELAHDPRLLWNMAICQKELRRYAKAVLLVEQYLRDGGAKLTPEMRQTATSTRDALKGLYSTATLKDAPAGTQVFVDDDALGTTPLPDPILLDVGSHRLRFEHPYYEPTQMTVDDVAGGNEMVVNVKMVPLSNGRLHVIAAPGDTIVIDDKVVGDNRWDGDVAAGKHAIRVTGLKKKSYEVSIDMAPRGSRTVNVTLQKDSGPVWPWIVGGAAVAAGAAIGGYFLFKSDDKPGTYTQGGLATIMLPASIR